MPTAVLLWPLAPGGHSSSQKTLDYPIQDVADHSTRAGIVIIRHLILDINLCAWYAMGAVQLNGSHHVRGLLTYRYDHTISAQVRP